MRDHEERTRPRPRQLHRAPGGRRLADLRARPPTVSHGEEYRIFCIVLSLLTGARTEELRALEWQHVHLEWVGDVPPHVEVWRSVREDGDTKTEKPRRTLALPGRCIEALRKHRALQAAERLADGERGRRRVSCSLPRSE